MAMESDDSKSENGTTPKLVFYKKMIIFIIYFFQSNVGNNNQAIGNETEDDTNKIGCPDENEIVESGGEADEDVGNKVLFYKNYRNK